MTCSPEGHLLGSACAVPPAWCRCGGL